MRKILIIALLLVPSITVAAGFAKQSLFLSKTTVTEGDTVLIHAVVSNDSSDKFIGQLVLTDPSETIGTVPVTLAAGEADTLSVSWKPEAGTQNVTAQLEASDGSVVETQTAAFTINPKPAPVDTTPQVTTASAESAAPSGVDSSQSIDQALTNISPAVGQAAAPVLAVTDSGRATAATALDNGISYAKGQIAAAGDNGSVLGTSTEKSLTTAKGLGNTLWLILTTALLYVLSVLRYVVGNAGIFYPIAAIIFLFIMWKLFARFRRA